MTKILAPIILLMLLAGCSSRKEITKPSSDNIDLIYDQPADTARDAMDQFINGSIAEAKGDYNTAIIDYTDVLRIQPKAGVYYALAKNYLFINKLPLALQNARKAIALDSTQNEFYDLLAEIYSTGNQYDSASVVLNKMISRDSSNVDAYYKLARIYEANKPLSAIKIYNKVTNMIGPDWNVLIHVAELYSNMGEYKQAAGSIKKLLTIDPSNVGLMKLLAEYYQRAKMYDDALNVIKDVLSFYPDDLDAHQREGQIYIAKGDWEAASKEYAYILKQPKVPLDLKIKIGASYFNQSLKDSTLTPIAKNFFKTIDKDTADWQVKMYLGAIAINQRDDSAAIDEFKQATQLASWNVEGWVRLGGLYFDNKKYDEAAKVMSEAVKTFPEDFRVNLILGLALAQNNKNKESLPYLKKAVELQPSDVTALSAYGYTLSQLKDNTEAVKYLTKALEQSPNDVNLLGTLGLIYDSQKNYTACDSVYSRALEIDSTSALINNNFAYSLSERGIKLDDALKMAKKAIASEPTNSSYLDTMGWIYFKLGDLDKAKDFVQKSLNVDSKNSDVLEHLGDIEFKMGNKIKALDAWKKALDLNKDSTELKQKIEKGET